MIDHNLFLFICSFVCVSAAPWSLHSGALARPSAVRPFLPRIAIVITSLFVFVSTGGGDGDAHPIFHMLCCVPTCLAAMWGHVISAGQWATSRGAWLTSRFKHRKGCEFSVCLAMLCGMWRRHDQNGKSDYGCSLDFWVTRTRSRLSGSEE